MRRNDQELLKEHFNRVLEEREKRWQDRFDAQEKALQIAEQNNRHWKEAADAEKRRADERERQYLSKGVGYILAAVAIIAAVLSVAEKVIR